MDSFGKYGIIILQLKKVTEFKTSVQENIQGNSLQEYSRIDQPIVKIYHINDKTKYFSSIF